MWNWLKIAFRYGRQILTALKDILPVLELLLDWLGRQDFTDETADDIILRTKDQLATIRDLLERVGYGK